MRTPGCKCDEKGFSVFSPGALYPDYSIRVLGNKPNQEPYATLGHILVIMNMTGTLYHKWKRPPNGSLFQASYAETN